MLEAPELCICSQGMTHEPVHTAPYCLLEHFIIHAQVGVVKHLADKGGAGSHSISHICLCGSLSHEPG